ncbi:MAG: SDR family oxidoreductase [Gammaproteobacteria bacterium]|jgi:NAD(P)-dependent dehydrogenase (short-subunit alcohol dehydrogenase family)|nr:SDR family oxidoreductase [Gammaproteobacteria bacterium]
MTDIFRLDGKTALVTGAGTGLGQHFAQVLARAGARVVIAARRSEKLAETESLITAAGGEAFAVSLDVRSASNISTAFDAAESRFGAVDILVNNAGLGGKTELVDYQEAKWDAIFDTNVKAAWLLSTELIRRSRQGDSSSISIVNIASILAVGAKFGLGPYMASKAAIVQLTRAMALEWGDSGVRANAISPGYFLSEMTEGLFDTPEGRAMQERIPVRRIGDLHELSGPLLLLASDASTYMNGSVVTVDGGHLCRTL